MKKSIFAVICLYLLLYILPLGVRPIIIPDETRYLEIPREMVATGDWTVPRLNGLLYFEKPAPGYWFNALSIMAFGETGFAVRFPSALAAGLSSLAVFLLARRFAGGAGVGLLSAAIHLTCVEVLGIGTFSVLDGPLAMLMTAALTLFFFAIRSERPARRNGLLFLFGVFCGLAFLVKGFLAFVIPTVVVIPFMIWEGRFRELLRAAWPPLLGALIASAPWSLAIHFQAPDFWRYFFWNQHVQRFLSPGGGQHPEPFWYYVPVMLAGALPWIFLAPAAIRGLRRRGSADPLVRFAVCWLAFPFLFFSLSSGKLATYVLPCFAPLSILLAVGLRHYFQDNNEKAFVVGARILGGLMMLVAITLAVHQLVGIVGIKPYGPGETWKWVSAAIGLVFWSAILWFSVHARSWGNRLALFAAAPILFFALSQGLLPELTLVRKAPMPLLERSRPYVGPETVLVSDGDLVRAVCAAFQRADVYMCFTRDELKYGLSQPDGAGRMLETQQLADRIRKAVDAAPGSHAAAVLAARAKKLEKIRDQLPAPAHEDVYGKFVVLRF